MDTLGHNFVFIIISILMIKHSDAYTKCNNPDSTKTAYGASCTSNSQCLTEYCNPNSRICSCPIDSFKDTLSGLCVRNSGPIFSSAGECGVLASPSSVSQGTLVTWWIYGEPRTYITIVVLEIDMYSTASCSTNYLEILEGSKILLQKTCNRLNSTSGYYASKSNSLTVSYRKASSTYKGFRAIYYTRSMSSELSETFGYIVSPGYPVDYNNYLNYTWLISAEKGHLISLTFDVDIESNYDYVRVFTGRYLSFPPFATHSGSTSLQYVISTANNILLQFSTDVSNSGPGFRAKYVTHDIGYGTQCSNVCLAGTTCSNGHCECEYNQYYNHVDMLCLPRVSFGYSCRRSEECFQSLVCRDSVCICDTNQYHNYSSGYCQYGVTYGYNCKHSECADGLYCFSDVCTCLSNQYYDQSFGICKVKLTYGNTCNSTEQCVSGLNCIGAKCGCLTSHYYDQSFSICRPTLAYGGLCTSTSQCQQELQCVGNHCNCSVYYYFRNHTCLAKHYHAANCSSSEECLSPYVCRFERIFTKKCLCPSDMHFITSNCLPHSNVQAVLSSTSVVKTNSILLKWTTQTWKSDFFFTVQWGSNYNWTKSTELFIDGLSPGRVYNFVITTNIPADQEYNNKSVQSKFSIETTLPIGQLCDPSIENMCELPDLICARDSRSTSNYTCQQKQHGNETSVSKKNTGEGDVNTAVIAVAVVGWVAALAAIIVVIVVCSRNGKKAPTNGPETQTIEAMSDLRESSVANVPPKNDYRLFPRTTDVQSSTSTTLTPSGTSQGQSTVPNTSASPSATSETNISTERPRFSNPNFGHDNETFTPDNNDNTYEDISENVVFDEDTIYQNVGSPNDNIYINSKI
ncbi:uncharacterized protein LOC106051286 isoform X2 [Biomphalaria glabrata]|uniref:Uncharacterized protein LOC106051286 isoform X2 n=1 Tax=Biomphalaria glabrata TaxID=6526 RepID=A0A9W3AJN7_BIOGL|nr:uncharacterized protein LOC106051286 isoform X2 [Biomphalaria glabrata]